MNERDGRWVGGGGAGWRSWPDRLLLLLLLAGGSKPPVWTNHHPVNSRTWIEPGLGRPAGGQSASVEAGLCWAAVWRPVSRACLREDLSVSMLSTYLRQVLVCVTSSSLVT